LEVAEVSLSTWPIHNMESAIHVRIEAGN
jgi:hypothetical protein